MKLPAPDVDALRAALVDWYEANRRDLPWRRRATPYRVWVSEILLQQTRVETVGPYYETFLRRFPTIARLAAAPLDDVLEAWSGLGYYRRARQLHAGAKHVIARHAGRFPKDPESALRVPGVGRYTAGAILSIAHGVRAPILDGNVIRVLARAFGIEGDPARSATRGPLWKLAERFVEKGEPGTVNQALMELGALVCTPRVARCGTCPWGAACVARRDAAVERLPAPSAKRPAVDVTCAVVLVRDGGRVLLRRRGEDELLPGMWDLPGAFGGDAGDRGRSLEEVAAALPVEVEVGARLGTLRHAITHRRITLEVIEARRREGRARGANPNDGEGAGVAARGTPLGRGEHRWCTVAEAAALALSAPARKILARWGAPEPNAIGASVPVS